MGINKEEALKRIERLQEDYRDAMACRAWSSCDWIAEDIQYLRGQLGLPKDHPLTEASIGNS